MQSLIRMAPALFALGGILFSTGLALADIKFEPPPRAENLQALSAPVDISYVKPNGNPTAKIVIPLATLKSLAETAKANKIAHLAAWSR